MKALFTDPSLDTKGIFKKEQKSDLCINKKKRKNTL